MYYYYYQNKHNKCINNNKSNKEVEVWERLRAANAPLGELIAAVPPIALRADLVVPTTTTTTTNNNDNDNDDDNNKHKHDNNKRPGRRGHARALPRQDGPAGRPEHGRNLIHMYIYIYICICICICM